MSITDELREWAARELASWKMARERFDALEAVADRIDAEHERAVMSAMNDALCHANDESMAELGWVRKNKEHVVAHAAIEVTPRIDWSRMADELDEFVEIVRGMMQFTDEQRRFIDEHYQLLPKDADDVPVCIGDRMEWVRYKDDGPTIVRTVSGIGNGVFFAWSDEQGRYAQYEAHAYRHHHAPTVEDVLREFADEVYADADNEIRDRDFLCAKYAKRLTLAEKEDA